jgi:hypothetical protein
MHRTLWIVQGLLALVFLAVGAMKLTMPADALAAQFPFPVLFMRVISALEILGAIGLILPGLLKIRPGLTPLAAAGLAIIMIGATAFTVVTMGAAMALVPLVLGLLAAFVAYGRWQLASRATSTYALAKGREYTSVR